MNKRQRRFQPGDVVRGRDGRDFGVVLHVEDFGALGLPVQLIVDTADEGAGTWPAELAVLSNDPASIAEARRLGLRGLPG